MKPNEFERYYKNGLSYVVRLTTVNAWNCVITGKGATGYGWAPKKEDAVVAAETDWIMSAGGEL